MKIISKFIVLLVVYSNITFAESTTEYRISIGDRIKVTVYGHQDLSGEFKVDGSGQVSLPLIKLVPAANLSKQQLEEAIAKKLKPDYLVNPRVSVEVLSYRPIYVMGEVKKPGSYPFVTGMTVVKAVALAGGFTYRAKFRSIYIIRSNDKTKKKINAKKDTEVFPGDIIEIPERFF